MSRRSAVGIAAGGRLGIESRWEGERIFCTGPDRRPLGSKHSASRTMGAGIISQGVEWLGAFMALTTHSI